MLNLSKRVILKSIRKRPHSIRSPDGIGDVRKINTADIPIVADSESDCLLGRSAKHAVLTMLTCANHTLFRVPFPQTTQISWYHVNTSTPSQDSASKDFTQVQPQRAKQSTADGTTRAFHGRAAGDLSVCLLKTFVKHAKTAELIAGSTNRICEGRKAIASVRLSISFHSNFRSNWPFNMSRSWPQVVGLVKAKGQDHGHGLG